MTKLSEKNDQIREAAKQKIKQAALNEFSKKGLSATRIQDIALAAQISQGLLYRYYPSKEEIYIDLISEALDKMNQASTDAVTMALSAREKILLALSNLFEAIEKSDRFRQTCRLIAQAMNTTALPEDVQTALDEKRELSYQAFAEIMKQGQEEQTIVEGDPTELSILFWSTVNGLAIYYATRKEASPLPNTKYVASMFLK